VANDVVPRGWRLCLRLEPSLLEAGTGHCEIYQLTYDPSSDPPTNDPNNLGPVFQADLPPATAIVPGSFGWDDTYFFYDRATGTGNFVFLVYGVIRVVETHTALPTTWDIITSGGFWVVDDLDVNFPEGGFSDLLFYDQARGAGEFYLHEAPNSTPQQVLAGYTSAGSVRAGQALNFSVSSQVGPYTIKIYRQSTDEIFMGEVTGLPPAPAPLPIRRAAWREGAGWPVAGTLEIPANWPGGLYLARVEAAGPTSLDIPFIVLCPENGSQSKIVVAMNDTTYNAYNHWGGRSHYGYGSLGTLYFTSPGAGASTMPWGYRLSMRRPQATVFPEYNAKWTYWEVPLARWLARRGIEVEWCTLVDIHADPGLLHRYAMLVNVGHAEYVSNEIREHIVRFVDAGGNAAFFGGNNTWWRIRIEDGSNVSACYKLASLDPVADPNGQTVNWSSDLSGEMQGVSWSGYAFAGDSHNRKDADGLLQYSVVDAGHWVFANTSLGQGDRFGIYGDGQQTIVGSETDVRTDQSPAGLEAIAFVGYRDPNSGEVSEVATMVVFSRGGTVFNASTNDWTLGLSQDSSWGPIDQITRNVFDRLGPQEPTPPPVRPRSLPWLSLLLNSPG
jgi:N,N-dimethylformamidase beta subunit-like, C-terminal